METMPKTRWECAGIERPCQFSRCKYNTGSNSIRHSCVLDVVDANPNGVHAYQEISDALGLQSRESARKYTLSALGKVWYGLTDISSEVNPTRSELISFIKRFFYGKYSDLFKLEEKFPLLDFDYMYHDKEIDSILRRRCREGYYVDVFRLFRTYQETSLYTSFGVDGIDRCRFHTGLTFDKPGEVSEATLCKDLGVSRRVIANAIKEGLRFRVYRGKKYFKVHDFHSHCLGHYIFFHDRFLKGDSSKVFTGILDTKYGMNKIKKHFDKLVETSSLAKIGGNNAEY